MNHYQQPQNNPYNPQNKGFSQQAGPNQYPVLPPVQNPQYPQYPPQQPQYPGAGYQPPAQYGNIQAESHKDEERKQVEAQITKLDYGFSDVWVNFYKIWLWIWVVIFTITVVLNIPNGQYFVVPLSLLMIWNICQAILGTRAISEKSLNKANVTCVMMCISLVCWLILGLFFISVIANGGSGPSHGWGEFFLFLIGLDALVIFTHIGMCIGGAFKVRRLIIERGMLQEKLNEINYSFRA